MDAIKAAIQQSIASAAQAALGGTLEVLTELGHNMPDGSDYSDGYRAALDDVGRRVAGIMAAIGNEFTVEVADDEV